LLAAFPTTTSQHFATSFRFHSCAEALLARSLFLAWLKGMFHSFTLRLVSAFAADRVEPDPATHAGGEQ
jgi:hypothetical protein